jgi:hypothetical protein
MTCHALRATFLRVEATRSMQRRYAPGRQEALRATFLRVEATRSMQRRYAPEDKNPCRAWPADLTRPADVTHRASSAGGCPPLNQRLSQ